VAPHQARSKKQEARSKKQEANNPYAQECQAVFAAICYKDRIVVNDLPVIYSVIGI
jgi:hypothetical protein